MPHLELSQQADRQHLDAGHHQEALAVLDRHGLEEASCDCYRIIEDEFDRLREMN